MSTCGDALRLALIGLGNQGQEHLAAARHCRDAVFVAGVDPNEACRAVTASHYADLGMTLLPAIDSLDAGSVDGLVLALPHHCYEDVWSRLIGFGLPILKEKPLGRSYDEAFAHLDAARRTGCPLQTAIQRRHHPSYRHLKEALDARGARVRELHSHLHLGFAQTKGDAGSWRGDRRRAGGGALLDAGYHLVDLAHYLVGAFDLVSASLWCNDAPLGNQEIDDRAWVTGRSETCWVMIDSWRGGETGADGKLRKSEGVTLQTDQGIWHANREGVWHEGVCINCVTRDWLAAMADQLDTFAANIRARRWHDANIWDQLPAMRVIDEAYRLAARY